MKKIIIALICLVGICSCNLNEQTCHLGPLNLCSWIEEDSSYLNEDFILYAGAGKTWIEGDSSWRDPIGGQLGLEYKAYEITNNLSLNTGIGISYQGSAYEEPMFSGVVRLSYISIPFLLKYESNCGMYGEIGLQPGFLLFARDRMEGSGESWSYGEFVKGFELGLPLGLGYNINDKLGLGVRATYGLTDMGNYGSEIRNHNIIIPGSF